MNAQPSPSLLDIQVAHSPDSDDAFMFYALATRKVATPGYRFSHVLREIEHLNQAAKTETYDVTAVSFHAYPYLSDKYALLGCGASFGENYGPMVVATRPMRREELRGLRIAVPGLLTTAYLALKLYETDFSPVVVPFDKILDEVAAQRVDAGLLIHEGQLLFPKLGMHRIVDLGEWWGKETGLPLPLGGNVIRRALGRDVALDVMRAIRASVNYALEHREEALNYALQFAREMEPELADKFVGMYVNRWTIGYGERGRAAVRELLARGTAAGLVPPVSDLEFIGDDTP